MTFTLLGHDAPAGRYPAAVVPVGQREGKLVAVFRSTHGKVVEQAVAPDAKFVRHDGEVRDRLRYFDAATAALFAFDERDVVSYPITGEQTFFESLLADPKLEHGDPFLRLALALETGYEDLVGPELVRAVASLTESAPRFLRSWYEQTAVRLATHGFRLAEWELERVLLLTGRGQFPRSARAILQQSRRLEARLRATIDRIRSVIRYESEDDAFARLGEILETWSDAQPVDEVGWVDRVLSGAADLEEQSARADLAARRVPRLRDLVIWAQETVTVRRHDLYLARRNAEREADEFERALRDAWLADLELARTRAAKRVVSIIDGWRLDEGVPVLFFWNREKALRSASRLAEAATRAVREEVDRFIRAPVQWGYDRDRFPNVSELLEQRGRWRGYGDDSRRRFAGGMPFVESDFRSLLRGPIAELIEPWVAGAVGFAAITAATGPFATRERVEMAIKHALLEGAGVMPGYRRAIDEWTRAAAREIDRSISAQRARWQAQVDEQRDAVDRGLRESLEELARLRDEIQRLLQPE